MKEERLVAHFRAAQEAGWRIVAADEEGAHLLNETDGRMIYAPVGEDIPPVIGTGTACEMSSAKHACAILSERREAAGLTVEDLAQLTGLQEGWLARFEDPRTVQAPGIEGFLIWAQALGIEVSLRPAPLPQTTLRWIGSTRNKAPARERRFAIERRRDVQRIAEKAAKTAPQ